MGIKILGLICNIKKKKKKKPESYESILKVLYIIANRETFYEWHLYFQNLIFHI